MITALALYLIFCVATAVTCLLSFWNPVVKAAEESGTNNTLVHHKYNGAFVYFCLTLLFAPAMFVILFSKSMSERYIAGLENIVKEPD